MAEPDDAVTDPVNDAVRFDLADGVAALTLNRPDVLNAMNGALIAALKARLDDVEHAVAGGSVRAVLLTGAGRGFCAGADLADPQVMAGAADLGTYLRQHYHPIIEQIRRIPAPVIAAVNGAAAGAGMSLALASDIVIAGRSATFLQAFSKIGLVPDAGSTYFLPRVIGESRARALAILADKLTAEQALQFGLVWQVLPDDELIAGAHAIASRLATMPTRAYALLKQAMSQSLGNDLPAQLELEATLQGQAGRTEDFREGVAAFLQKRKPTFKGR